MRFPFPKWLPKIPVKVVFEGTDADGEYITVPLYEGLAFYDEKTRQIMDAERRLVLLSGLVIIEGDIQSGSESWSGDKTAANDPVDGDISFQGIDPAVRYWELFYGKPFGTGEMKGYVEINGMKKAIFRTLKPRNPDGTVYSTELMLA